jgi:iron(III) transport system ATP-binding protein
VLDVAVRGLTFAHPRSSFALSGVEALFRASTHAALVGPGGCGATTLLRVIAGDLRPQAGQIVIGTRDVTAMRASRRPLLFATSRLEVPARWSVQHALIAAVSQRRIDRTDRQRELALAAEGWRLTELLERRIDTLSATEQTLVLLARIELLRPGILVADRLLERASPAALPRLADDLYRMLRIAGTTVINAPASHLELGYTDAVIVLDGGAVAQSGTAADVYARPRSEAAAAATGRMNAVPMTIDGKSVESPIGSWELAMAPFAGDGLALVRPGDFAVAGRGEDSDFLFSVEEAGFHDGHWQARGLVSGGFVLQVDLPAGADVHKGKLLPLRYDPARFALIPSAPRPRTPIGDPVPSMRETR